MLYCPYTGAYPYTKDLLSLARVGIPGSPTSVREELSGVYTPLKFQHWESMLAAHPDKEYVSYLLSGIREGFRIGFNRSSQLTSARKNMQSADEHPSEVIAYLNKEKENRVILGPFSRKDMPTVIISRFGVIPK